MEIHNSPSCGGRVSHTTMSAKVHTLRTEGAKTLMGPPYTRGTERCLQCRRLGEGWELEISAVAGSKGSQLGTSSLPVRA